jgi:hypothetical protein
VREQDFMESKLAALISIINLPGYAVLCEYFQREIRTMENEVFKISPEEKEHVLAAHRVALGARWAFDLTMKKIDADVRRALEEQKPQLTEAQLDELHVRTLEGQ